jgi:hypothetical protein
MNSELVEWEVPHDRFDTRAACRNVVQPEGLFVAGTLPPAASSIVSNAGTPHLVGTSRDPLWD